MRNHYTELPRPQFASAHKTHTYTHTYNLFRRFREEDNAGHELLKTLEKNVTHHHHHHEGVEKNEHEVADVKDGENAAEKAAQTVREASQREAVSKVAGHLSHEVSKSVEHAKGVASRLAKAASITGASNSSHRRLLQDEESPSDSSSDAESESDAADVESDAADASEENVNEFSATAFRKRNRHADVHDPEHGVREKVENEAEAEAEKEEAASDEKESPKEDDEEKESEKEADAPATAPKPKVQIPDREDSTLRMEAELISAAKHANEDSDGKIIDIERLKSA